MFVKSKQTIHINGRELSVEIPNKDDMKVGLSHRKSLGYNNGMLFVFNGPGFHQFHMIDTLIPLSIAFIDSKGMIISITDMKPLSTKTYSIPQMISYALEVNKGWFIKNGIGVGDYISKGEWL